MVADPAGTAFAAGIPYRKAASGSRLRSARGAAGRLVIPVAAAYRHLGAPADDIVTVLAHTADRGRELS